MPPHTYPTPSILPHPRPLPPADTQMFYSHSPTASIHASDQSSPGAVGVAMKHPYPPRLHEASTPVPRNAKTRVTGL
ncbi:hypothetical protein V6N13_042807 [Hibiscus sabdariffa]